MFHLMKLYTETQYKLFLPEFHVGKLVITLSAFIQVWITV